MNQPIENPYFDIKSLELLRFERDIFLALAAKIIEVFEKPNDFSSEAKEFWLKRGVAYNEFAAANNELITKFIEILDSQTKAANAHFN